MSEHPKTTRPSFPPGPDPERFTRCNTELRSTLVGADPLALARNTGAEFRPDGITGPAFYLHLWGDGLRISYPEFVIYNLRTGKEVPAINQALLLYYFNIADGTSAEGRWISFTDLPDGRFYTQAFQGYSGALLAQSFQNDLEAFQRVAVRLGGEPQALGDAAFAFQALPRVWLLAAYWLGDEDFPASCKLLFDASASHYLTTDAYAILGSTLTRKLLAVREAA